MFWSISAHHCWRRCQKQFFFDQIMGNAQANDPKRKRAYEVGLVQDPKTWVGSVIHSTIQRGLVPELRQGRWPSEKIVSELAAELARSQFAFSAARAFEDTKKSEAGDRFCILAPHYFNQPEPSDTLRKSVATITQSVERLLRSQRARKYFAERRVYRAECAFAFAMQPMTVRAVADLVMIGKDDRGVEIVDWKATRSYSRAHLQVAVYALAAQQTETLKQYRLEDPSGYVVNVFDDDPGAAFDTPFRVSSHALTETTDFIYESVESIQAVVQGRKYDQLDIDDFEYAQNPNTCAICNWRLLCAELSNDPASGKPVSDHEPEAAQLELPFV